MKLLNPRQEKFCIEYARTGNATIAYKLAGFQSKSNESAQANSARLLADERIQARLRELADEIKDTTVADRQELLQFTTAVLRGEIKSVVLGRDGNPIELPAQLKDRLKSLELLAKLQGLFVSKQELEISQSIPIVINDNI